MDKKNLQITLRGEPEDSMKGDQFYKKKGRKRDDDDDEYFEQPRKPRRKNSDLEIEYDDKIYRKSKECEYFRKLNRKRQMEIIDKEDEVLNYHKEEVPLRYRILFSDLSIPIKSLIIQKIDQYEAMTSFDSEYSKLGKWLKGVSNIPFNLYVEMPVNMNDDSFKIKKFLSDAQSHLEKTIFGQFEVKNKIIQIMAQWISNPKSRGQIIALEGPPGVGKTSLVKNGVSKALNRPFCFYALGGASDASNLEGHSYTYEGAIWGRIVDMLMESKVMNPVVFFDELDKISDTSKGHEITGVLTHLTDNSQNNCFYDKYFAGIPFDISRTLFFFSYNDKELINPILKDRLTVIKFEGYGVLEKTKICLEYILPELLQLSGFQKDEIIIKDIHIKYIIEKYCKDEEGVRQVKRCLEDIIMKINLLRLIYPKQIKKEIPEKTGKEEEEKEKEEEKKKKEEDEIHIPYKIDNFTIPFHLDEKSIDIFLKKSSLRKNTDSRHSMLYI